MKDAILIICKDLDGQAPDEIQIVPYGFHRTPKGDFDCDDESIDAVISEFNKQMNDVVIDYEHQTLEGVVAPAGGWIKKLINKGREGIWAAVEWTGKAKKHIEDREYRYISPVFLRRKSDNKVMKIINVALTNQPNIDGMVPLINKLSSGNQPEKEDKPMKELLKLLGLSETASEADCITAVNKLKEQAEKDVTIVANKAVLESLGLKENAGEADVVGAITKMKQPRNDAVVIANKAVLDALGLKEDATESEVTGTIMAMKQSGEGFEALSQQVTKLTDDLKKRETSDIEAMVNKAIEGDEAGSKLSPAQKEWAMEYAKRDPEGFKVFIAKAPVVVRKGQVVTETTPAGDKPLDDMQVQINKLMGIDDETFKKYGPQATA